MFKLFSRFKKCTYCGSLKHSNLDCLTNYNINNSINVMGIIQEESSNKERKLLLKTLDVMGYNEMEFINEVEKGRTDDVIELMKLSSDKFTNDELNVINNLINKYKEK